MPILESNVAPERSRNFATRSEATFGEIADAAWDAARYVNNSDARQRAYMRAYDDRARDVYEATGVLVANPLRAARDEHPDPLNPSPFPILFGDEEAKFMARLAELAVQFPDHASRIAPDRTVSDDARGLAKAAETRLSEAAGSRATLDALPGLLAGGFLGGIEDPLQIVTAPLGAAGGGRTALTAIVRAGVVNAAAAGGVAAASQPLVQSWRAESGLPYGLSEAAKDVAWATAFGGALGAGIEGIGRGVRRVAGRAPEPAARPEAAAFDDTGVDATIRVARATPTLDPEARAALRRLEAEREAEGLAPKTIDVEDHLAAISRAERFLDDPANQALPLAPEIVPRADGPAVTDSNAAGFGRSLTIGAKPVEQTMVRAKELGFDAAAFQYKGGADALGITEKLRGVQTWDQSSAGWVYVYERADGARIVADGHQRTGLAQRLEAEGRMRDVELPAFVFREKDGWTPQEVRARAAQKNIREGTGDVVDTATVLREAPWLLDRSLPLGSEHLRQAISLSKLSPEAFGMVRGGVITPSIAQAIGEQAASAPMLHRGLAEALVRQDVSNASQARIVVAAALRAGAKDTEARAQMTLFGDDFFAQTHIIEQAKVLDGALKKLGSDARLFSLLREKGERIEAKGNVLAGEVNARTAQLARIAGDLVERLARVDGPVADIVDDAARKVARRELSAAKASEQVATDVIALFERDGLDGVINRKGMTAAPDKAPTEPATPEALERAEVQNRTEMTPEGEKPPAEPSLFDMLPAEGEPKLLKRDLFEAEAKRDGELADMIAICNRGAARTA